jgi:predicted PhzF superfamily epimerase YddE/YHI9
MHLPVTTWNPPASAVARAIRALNVSGRDVDPRLPLQVVSAGAPHFVVPIREESVLDALHADRHTIAAIAAGVSAVDVLAFALVSSANSVAACRLFGPSDVQAASAPLGAYLALHHILPHDARVVRQRGANGVETLTFSISGRCVITVEVTMQARRVARVRIADNTPVSDGN